MRLRGPNLDKIKIVIFDLDGVVVYPSWGFANYLDREHKITREHTREFFAGPFNDSIRGNVDVKDVLPPYLASWNWPGTVDDFVDFWLKAEDSPDIRLLDLIRELRESGMKCGLGTNQEKHRAQFIRKNMRFESMFDHLFISCELGSFKPEDAFFKRSRSSLIALLTPFSSSITNSIMWMRLNGPAGTLSYTLTMNHYMIRGRRMVSTADFKNSITEPYQSLGQLIKRVCCSWHNLKFTLLLELHD